MIPFKVGDFIHYNDNFYNEFLVITKINEDVEVIHGLVLETISEYSLPFIGQKSQLIYSKLGKRSIKLVTDEEIINKLKKKTVFL